MRPVLNEMEILCCGCNACVASCPTDCISMEANSEGFLYPLIDETRCISCNRCQKSCPVISYKNSETIISARAASSKDQRIKMSSSSGGVFELLGEKIIEKGGCVYGAAFTEDFHKVRHIIVDDTKSLEQLKTSKYLQSSMGNAYRHIHMLLKNNIIVLFSGTPCQVAGLNSYLMKDYDNLFCIEVICHGVPSPILWSTYLDHVIDGKDGIVKFVNFRDKRHGWYSFGLSIRMEKEVYYKQQQFDPYMQMFLKNVCLRESCYKCKVKENGSGADLSIGDFWGVKNIAPQLEDKMGTSLVLIHTKKGEKLLASISNDIKLFEVDVDDSIKSNSLYRLSVIRPNTRDVFFGEMNSLSWKKFVKKYGHISLWSKGKKTIARIKSKVRSVLQTVK